jgi:hypothetical protein
VCGWGREREREERKRKKVDDAECDTRYYSLAVNGPEVKRHIKRRLSRL